MEAAENRRLLYVACTRAADLLLLSGQVGRGHSWLNQIMDAWGIDGDGPAEEILSLDGFQVSVARPAYPEMTEAADAPVASTDRHPGLTTVPPLAEPLPSTASPAQIAVTRLARTLERDPDALPAIYPAMRPGARDRAGGRVPGYLIGNLVHQLLADWDCLAWPEEELGRHAALTARAVGILREEEIRVASRRALTMLRRLKASPLYGHIQAAAQRMSEAPFTLHTSLGVLHGVIDLLFLDQDGRWRLIDWKTEWVAPGGLDAAAESHRLQLAVYAEAARQILGERPTAQLCFLAAGAVLYSFEAGELQQAWTEVTAHPPRDNVTCF